MSRAQQDVQDPPTRYPYWYATGSIGTETIHTPSTTPVNVIEERKRCGRLERGEDCSFDEEAFYAILLTIFAVTTLLFLYQAWAVRRKDKTPGMVTRPQLSLLMAAGSAFCIFLDMFMILTDLVEHVPLRSDHEFSFFGSMLLFAALLLFAQRWCHVVQVLEKRLHGNDDLGEDKTRPSLASKIILAGYWFLMIAHVPFAVFRVVQWPEYHLAITLFTWCVIVEAVILSFLAILMCVVAFRMSAPDSSQPKTSKNISQLRWVTLLNLVEQIVFDAALIAIHRLYFSESYMLHGSTQAVYFSLWFTVYWAMHIQIFIFFRFVTLSDEHEIGLLSDEIELDSQQGNDIENQASKCTSEVSLGEDGILPAVSPDFNDITMEVGEVPQATNSAFPQAPSTAVHGKVLGSPSLENAYPLEGVRDPVGTLLGSPSLGCASPLQDVRNPLDL